MQLNRFMWEDVEKGVFRKIKELGQCLNLKMFLKLHQKT